VGAPSVGDIVLVPFPFSDLSGTKKRRALLLADAGRDDLPRPVRVAAHSPEAAVQRGQCPRAAGALRGAAGPCLLVQCAQERARRDYSRL
jgi:hypothetical protein